MSTYPNGYTGSKSNIHLTPVQLTTEAHKLNEGVQILAAIANNGTVYVGIGNTITANGGDSTTGFPLASGDSILLPIRTLTDVFVVGSASGQKVWWAAF